MAEPTQDSRRAALWALLGGPPETYPDPVPAQRDRADGYSISRLSGGDGWAATLLTPDRPNRAGVLYCHAHGNRWDIGARELTNGRPAIRDPLGPELTRRGFTLLCVEMPGFGTRQGEGPESALAKAALWQGDTLMGRMLRDLVRGLDVLSGLGGIDPARIASLGLSMGATHAYWLAALDMRVARAAHLCAFADIGPLIESGTHDLHGPYMTVPGLIGFGDMGAVAGLVAPRPQLVCAGADDPLTPDAALRPALAKLRAAYAGVPGLQVFVETGEGHRATPAMRARVIAFLDGLV